jgi:hypothetical protein
LIAEAQLQPGLAQAFDNRNRSADDQRAASSGSRRKLLSAFTKRRRLSLSLLPLPIATPLSRRCAARVALSHRRSRSVMAI